MDEHVALLRYFLAAIAYRFRNATADAPDGFGEFEAGQQVRAGLSKLLGPGTDVLVERLLQGPLADTAS